LTPLHLTVSTHVMVTDIMCMLLKRGANVDLEDGKGQTPFQIALSREKYDITQPNSGRNGSSVLSKWGNLNGAPLNHRDRVEAI
jgi:ankyrin repeat protein